MDDDRRPRTCIHYDRNVIVQDGICLAELRPIDEFCNGDTLGMFYRLPCFEANTAAPVCPRREFLSHEALAERRRKFSEYASMVVALSITLPDDDNGIAECPKCGGVVYLSRAPVNRHLRARCSTEGCITFME